MADSKALDRAYLLRQLQLLAGHELYGDVKTKTIVSYATASKYAGSFAITTYTYYKYTGSYQGTDVATAEDATNYTTLCGETIVVGDKVRACILVTDDNISQYASLVPGVASGDYIYPTADCHLAGASAQVELNYLNNNFFKDDPVVAGDLIDYTPDVINETDDPAGNYIKDLYNRKLSLELCTVTEYNTWKTAGTLKDNTVYYVVNASEPTAWLKGQNILGGGGGIDTSTAHDGDFLVYSASESKPVWKEIIDAMEVGW